MAFTGPKPLGASECARIRKHILILARRLLIRETAQFEGHGMSEDGRGNNADIQYLVANMSHRYRETKQVGLSGNSSDFCYEAFVRICGSSLLSSLWVSLVPPVEYWDHAANVHFLRNNFQIIIQE
jgi:hypothetical protein